MRPSRLFLPGARIIGGRSVRCVPGSVTNTFEPTGVLAEPASFRGVTLPAGSRVVVEVDTRDVTVELGGPTRVEAWIVPAGAKLRFPGRALGFAGLRVPLWVAPIFLPAAWLSVRAGTRRIYLEHWPAGMELALGLPAVPCVIHGGGRVEPMGRRG